MQPPNEGVLTLFSKASSNVVESATILMEFAAVPHEGWAELAGENPFTRHVHTKSAAAHTGLRRHALRPNALTGALTGSFPGG
jgi:hypothetical protein